MNSVEIISIAKKMGIKNAAKMKKIELIRTIQSTEGNNPCFETGLSDCPEMNCCWREDCLKTTENAMAVIAGHLEEEMVQAKAL